ncbi:hypothetical protein COCOBI_05-7050 [Coccomyxa sp. Obi]|nr:hypothetical protein COCOBI_05-7050 [Coccomyxa sp. Obi]
MDVDISADRRESVLSDITDPQPRTSRDQGDAEESEEDFSNPLYRTSSDGTEVGTRSLAPGTTGRARRAVGAEAYDSDDSTSSDQGLHFTDVPTHQWNEQIGLQVQEAIVHSQEVFLRQVQLKERALVTRVLHAWRDIKYFAFLP